MTGLTSHDLLSHAEYEKERTSFRERIIALKKRRRVAIGNLITLVFENRDTVQFQIQEMIRTERIFDPEKIQDEIDVYNKLLPGQDQLSATLFIEITDSDQIKERLDLFQKIDRPGTLAIQLASTQIFADFEGGHSKEDKISAVHFVTFQLATEFQAKLGNIQNPVSLLMNHPHYQAETQVSDEMRREWMADLTISR